MAIAFTYTEATNIVVVTGGTSGTPATFADFVTADRAGTAELLAESTGESAMTLTYPVRPVEAKAIKVNIVVTDKVEDGYVHVHGTDFAGNAQNESIATNSSDTYETVLYYATITSIDCTVESDGGGDDWAEGSIQVTQPQWGVIWDYGGGQYRIDANFSIGNGSTATYFASESEMAYFNECSPKTFASATLRIGDVSNEYSKLGSYWNFKGQGYTPTMSGPGGIWLVYCSILQYYTGDAIWWQGGTHIFKNTNILGSGLTKGWVFGSTVTAIELSNVYITNLKWLDLRCPATIDVLHSEASATGISARGNILTIEEFLTTNNTGNDVEFHEGGIITFLNPQFLISTIWINLCIGYEAYTVDINVADKDGAALQNVDVLIEDQDSKVIGYVDSETDLNEALDDSETEVDVDDGTKFSAGNIIKIDTEFMYIDSISTNTLTVQRGYYTNYVATVHNDNTDIFIAKAIPTDASGDITKTIVNYKYYYGSGTGTVYTYSPHKFTLSKAGYETLILENVTVDVPIVWHLELQHVGGAKNKQIGLGVNI